MNKDDQIRLWMDEICQQIPSFFQDDVTIKRHIDSFVMWNEIEWFNVALILYQNFEASLIRSKTSWEKLLNNPFFIKKGEKGIKIIVPAVYEDSFKWTKRIVWDINQSQNKINIGIESKMRQCIEQLFDYELYENINLEELLLYIKSKYENHIDKRLKKSAIQEYIKKCICYVLSNYLPVNINFIDLKLSSVQWKEETYIYLYSSLKMIINFLPDYITAYFEEKMSREKEIKAIENAQKYINMNINQRIKHAQIRLNEQFKSNEDEAYDYLKGG